MIEHPSAFETFELNLPPSIVGFLREISNWSYFLSILGFVGIGLTLLFGIFFSLAMGFLPSGNPYGELGMNMNMSYIGLFYVVGALLYFFPVLYLFNFSRQMKRALKYNTNDNLTAAFSNLKSHYKYLGIFTIAIIGLYVLIFVGAMFTALF